MGAIALLQNDVKAAKAAILDGFGNPIRNELDRDGNQYIMAGDRVIGVKPSVPDEEALTLYGPKGFPLVAESWEDERELFEQGFGYTVKQYGITAGKPTKIEQKDNVTIIKPDFGGDYSKPGFGRVGSFLWKHKNGIAAVVALGAVLAGTVEPAGAAEIEPVTLDVLLEVEDVNGPVAPSIIKAGYDPSDPLMTDNYDPLRDFLFTGPTGSRNIMGATNIYDPKLDANVRARVDFRAVDPNAIDVQWDWKLYSRDPIHGGLSGDILYSVVDFSSLNNIPDYCVAYLTHKDVNGVPVTNYNLRDNPSDSWYEDHTGNSIANPFGTLSMVIKDEYLAAKDLVPGSDIINMEQFGILAQTWKKVGPNKGDINGDNVTDAKDLQILAGYWLVSPADLK